MAEETNAKDELDVVVKNVRDGFMNKLLCQPRGKGLPFYSVYPSVALLTSGLGYLEATHVCCDIRKCVSIWFASPKISLSMMESDDIKQYLLDRLNLLPSTYDLKLKALGLHLSLSPKGDEKKKNRIIDNRMSLVDYLLSDDNQALNLSFNALYTRENLYCQWVSDEYRTHCQSTLSFGDVVLNVPGLLLKSGRALFGMGSRLPHSDIDYVFMCNLSSDEFILYDSSCRAGNRVKLSVTFSQGHRSFPSHLIVPFVSFGQYVTLVILKFEANFRLTTQSEKDGCLQFVDESQQLRAYVSLQCRAYMLSCIYMLRRWVKKQTIYLPSSAGAGFTPYPAFGFLADAQRFCRSMHGSNEQGPLSISARDAYLSHIFIFVLHDSLSLHGAPFVGVPLDVWGRIVASRDAMLSLSETAFSENANKWVKQYLTGTGEIGRAHV